MSFWIDTQLAERVAGAWAERGDEWFRLRAELEARFADLDLSAPGDATLHHLAAAGTESWVASSFVSLVIDRVVSSDAVDVTDPETVAGWYHRAGAPAHVVPLNACALTWEGFSFSSTRGDPGETGDAEVRSPYSVVGTTAVERGRELVVRALVDIDDRVQIHEDEFQLVHLLDDRYLLVLPGVTDLSTPHLGLDPRHRTVRDVDQYAFESSRSTSVAGNRYARMVWDGLVAAGVPAGAELMIVGHSFGADTALDLAVDPGFNGPGGFDVTHVVAAGYHSVPQLRSVAPTTQVLVLRNRWDMAVAAEAVGHGHVTEAVTEAAGALADLVDPDPVGLLGHLGGFVAHQTGAAVDAARAVVDRRDAVARVVTGAVSGSPVAVGEGLVDLLAVGPGVQAVGEHQVVDVFHGGVAGVGHAPSNYIAHLTSSTDPALAAFFGSVAAAGYATGGTAWAIDVSVPAQP